MTGKDLNGMASWSRFKLTPFANQELLLQKLSDHWDWAVLEEERRSQRGPGGPREDGTRIGPRRRIHVRRQVRMAVAVHGPVQCGCCNVTG